MTNRANMKKITFRELYSLATGEKKPTPRQLFIAECAKVAAVAESTVKQWITGVQVPNKYALQLLSEHFDCDPEYLFPKEQVS